eukprot:332620-Prorocentrum_lima.AAC.1
MTSSLVGSEMCIRDRTKQFRDDVGRMKKEMEGMLSPDLQISRSAGLQAVSYTHLTLPTICSV